MRCVATQLIGPPWSASDANNAVAYSIGFARTRLRCVNVRWKHSDTPMPPVMYQSANITATADQLNEPGMKTKSTPTLTIQSPMRIGQFVDFMDARYDSSGRGARIRVESRMRLKPRAIHYLV